MSAAKKPAPPEPEPLPEISPIIVECEQGTDEWDRLRLGVLTSSDFDKLITPGGKPTSGAAREKYLTKKLAEWWSGESDADDISDLPYVARGYMLQPQQVAFYGFEKSRDIDPVGFIFADERMLFGASTDGLSGEERVIEGKGFNAADHLRMVRSGELGTKAKPQIQGELLCTGRAFCDLILFHPKLPSAILEVERDKPYIAQLHRAIEEALELLAEWKQQIIDRHGEPPARKKGAKP